jgi:hypothetical protein
VKFWLSNIILFVFAGTVIYSGFAYPLQYGTGAWPFNRDWFMFSTDAGYDYELQALGYWKDGSTAPVDVGPLFRFKVGAEGNRFQETPRHQDAMDKMARYLCAKFPLEAITLNDVFWLRPEGKRLKAKDLPPEQLQINTWVDHYRCGT